MIGKCNTGGENVTPEVTTQTPIIQNITEALVGKAQGATATAETILKGFSAYVNGKLVDGAYEPISLESILESAGLSKVESGSITFSSSTYIYDLKINHNLGVIPKLFFMWKTGSVHTDYRIGWLAVQSFYQANSNSGYFYGVHCYDNTISSSNVVWIRLTDCTDKLITFVKGQSVDTNGAMMFDSGTYDWIAMA